MILGISDAINNEDKNVDPNLLDEYKNQIETINEKIRRNYNSIRKHTP